MSNGNDDSTILRAHAVSIPTPMATQDPFLFCVYHRDMYPDGNAAMEAPGRGNGADFDARKPWRFYHGTKVPGFPAHPHVGFETITAVMEGTIDHTDSMGNAGRYSSGDLQHMTAGKGIQHSEMFPLRKTEGGNTLQLFQIWLNLPGKDKMVEPAFVMHWNENVKRMKQGDGVELTVWTGEYDGVKALSPTPNSWAAKEENDVGVYLIKMQAGKKFTLKAARCGTTTNRSLYFVEGQSVRVCSQVLDRKAVLDVNASHEVAIENTSEEDIILLVLQGRPINEPVAQHGPFVMNTREEIAECFAEYRRTAFGGWPWDSDDYVFPRDKGRFALIDGVESVPK
jgi:redox-sensitive bicupin YhaK (pirin superfamily)